MQDLIIIGAGPAGLNAALFAARYGMEHLLLGENIGGQAVEAVKIENWAGIREISGKELMEQFFNHAKEIGAKYEEAPVKAIKKKEDGFEVFTDNEHVYETKNVILALGMKPRQMNIPGEKEFVGKGVSYCATCDDEMFSGKTAIVIGGGDSAGATAMHLAKICPKVYLLCQEAGICIKPALLSDIKSTENIENIMCDEIKEIIGTDEIEAVKYVYKGEEKTVEVEMVSIEIGAVPGVAIAEGIGVELDERGYIKVNADQSTNVPGVYAAGDVTTGSNGFRQIITASAEGALAASTVFKAVKK